MKKLFVMILLVALGVACSSDNAPQTQSSEQGVTAYVQAAAVKEDQEDFQGAIADYTKALELCHASDVSMRSFIYNKRGWCKNFLKDFKGAVKDHARAVEIDPNNDDAYFGLASVSMKEKKYKEAIAYLTNAIDKAPSTSQYYFFRGFSNSKLQNYQNAVADYTKSLELTQRDGNKIQGYQLRAEAKRALGDEKGALADERKAQQLSAR
ncbi:tetratricopeptide repeat protein [Candidatus Avelusimicrobium luingense]|uniref:tetratricopeptide repeat protein n=1 Tax=Candidatus Avelusimicrobium luingense TaxID=3416211 RepID=UPI003D105F57